MRAAEMQTRETCPSDRPLHRPLAVDDPDLVGRMRAALERAGYARLAARALQAVAPRARPDAAMASGAEIHPLVRLFALTLPADEAAVRRGLAPMKLEEWVEAGLVESRDGRAVPLARLAPYRGLVVASDTARGSNGSTRADAVMGLTGSSLWLAQFTIRRPSRRTLDLGTGGGLQALLAAPHSERVVAVDVNPRALDYARFNARLNGISNIEFIEGDLFGAVEGEKFDLVVSNPPFVISPEQRTLCPDNPLDGDAFVQRIVRDLPRHLDEGGYGQIVCDWVQSAGEPWPARLAQWFRRGGCDAWVLRGQTKQPSKYARAHAQGRERAEFEKACADWLAYFEREGIEGIGFGVITVRRRSGRAHWFRADETPGRIGESAGEAVVQGFAAGDFLSTRKDNRALLSERFRPAPHLRVEPQLAPGPPGWGVRSAQLTLTGGLCYSGRVDPALMRLVLGCDGKPSLGELLGEVVVPARGRGAADLTPKFLAAVRQLIALSFLWPVGERGASPGERPREVPDPLPSPDHPPARVGEAA